ncbi:hypothetical protein FHG87_018546 [Trinorchestia longiramus]|nr:hypothetical protein FHG87_018546 [Trinorchestia longiramus]
MLRDLGIPCTRMGKLQNARQLKVLPLTFFPDAHVAMVIIAVVLFIFSLIALFRRGGYFCAAVKRNKVQTVPCIPGRVTQGMEVSGLGSCTHRLATHRDNVDIDILRYRFTECPYLLDEPSCLGLGAYSSSRASASSCRGQRVSLC